MTKKERVEDLGKISVLIDQAIFVAGFHDKTFNDEEISSFIQKYSDKKNLQDLFHSLSGIKRLLLIVRKISEGDEE